MESVANGEQERTPRGLEQIAGDLDAAYERLTLGIEYLRSTAEPDWQDMLAHLKLARQCLGRDPGDRLRAQAEADKVLREKAALWDALMGSSRVRVLGSAGLDLDTREVAANGYAHLCMEIWTIYGWDVVKDPEMSAAIAALHAGDDLDFEAIEQRHAAAEDALHALDPGALRTQVGESQ